MSHSYLAKELLKIAKQLAAFEDDDADGDFPKLFGPAFSSYAEELEYRLKSKQYSMRDVKNLSLSHLEDYPEEASDFVGRNFITNEQAQRSLEQAAIKNPNAKYLSHLKNKEGLSVTPALKELALEVMRKNPQDVHTLVADKFLSVSNPEVKHTVIEELTRKPEQKWIAFYTHKGYLTHDDVLEIKYRR